MVDFLYLFCYLTTSGLDFAFSTGIKQTGIKNCMQITNLSRTFHMKPSNNQRVKEWSDALEKFALNGPGKEFIQANPFRSFAPERSDQLGYWFSDGQTFMSAVADVIEAATEQIFITDWWLSPEIYLKRGLEFDEGYRLDNLLKRKAVSFTAP